MSPERASTAGHILGARAFAAVMTLVIVGLSIAFSINICADPYSVRFHSQGSYLVPSGQLLDWKLRQVARINATGAIIGNSRVWTGFSQTGAAGITLGDRPFNLGIQSLSIGDVQQIAHFLTRCTKVRKVVILLDMNMFDGHRPDRANITSHIHLCRQPLRYEQRAIKEYISVFAVLSSIEHMRKGDGYDSYGFLHPVSIPKSRGSMWLTARSKAFDYLRGGWSVETSLTQYSTYNHAKNIDRFDNYRLLLRNLYDNGYSVNLVIPPLHLSNNKILSIKHMDAIEAEWRRRILAVNLEEAARSRRTPFQIYDFELYFTATNSNLFDTSVLETGRSYYIEPSHFSPRLGTQIIRLIGHTDRRYVVTSGNVGEIQTEIINEMKSHPNSTTWVDAVANALCQHQPKYLACQHKF